MISHKKFLLCTIKSNDLSTIYKQEIYIQDDTIEFDFGKLSLINEAFQYCYLDKTETNSKFINLINSQDGNYSRYLFFYLNNLIKKNDFKSAIQLSKDINVLDSNLLIQQSKQWIDNSEFNNFGNLFSS